MIFLSSLLTATLTFTTPSVGQHQWMVFDPEVAESTVATECSGGPVLHDTLEVYLWKQNLTGGPFYNVESHFTLPGVQDSFPNQDAGHYMVRARNSAGFGCWPDHVTTIMPLDPTGVPVEAHDTLVSVRVFDVRGRLVRGPPASGIYFERRFYRSGRVETKRKVLLR